MSEYGSSEFDELELKRIRWHSRRGLLELDLVLERFLARHFDSLTEDQLRAYRALLDLPDNDFLDVINRRADITAPELVEMVELLRQV